MFDVMIVLRCKRTDHAEPPLAMSDEDISKAVAEALQATFPKAIGYGPPVSQLVHADGTKPRPSVVLSLVGARVMVLRPEDLPAVNGTVAPEANGVVAS